MNTSSAQSLKNFTKIFERLAYSQSYSSVFSDFLDFALLMLNVNKSADDFKELERRWPKKEDQELFAAMLIEYSNAADNDGEGFYDALGDLFMELLSHGKNGQYFTPQPICDMMTMMSIGSHAEAKQTVCDPTCGSGRMLLAAAKLNREMRFFGADVDITCCKMTVLNMLINTMEGEVAWMNTLSMDHWKSWHIKRVLDTNGFYLPYYFETGPGETHFIERLKNSIQPNSPPAVPTVSKDNQLSLF